jgi:beta-lactamase class A
MIDASIVPSSSLLARSIAISLIAAAPLVTGGCGGGTSSTSRTVAPKVSQAVVPPKTPAGIQARWLLAASANLPIPVAEVRAHFAAGFLEQVSAEEVNAALASAGRLLGGSGAVAVGSVDVDQPRQLVLTVARAPNPPRVKVSLAVDGEGLISGLLIQPVAPPMPTSWPAVDAMVRFAAPNVRMLVADVSDGSCRAVHAIDPATPAPLGSVFKLYVLDALGRAVASGSVAWNDPLTVTSAAKSLPSGELQSLPAGTRVSVEDAAAKMISISDNTAADMLIAHLGRQAVEATLAATGMANPGLDRPFLTTRELFILKLEQWPTLAREYLEANEAGRRAVLARIDRMSVPALTAASTWTAPRDIAGIEWFASPDDLCRVYLSLHRLFEQPGLAPLGRVLEINQGGLDLDPARWQSTWFKAGSEVGVLTMTFLATTRTGRRYFAAVLADDPTSPIDEGVAAPAMLSAIKGALTLAASP